MKIARWLLGKSVGTVSTHGVTLRVKPGERVLISDDLARAWARRRTQQEKKMSNEKKRMSRDEAKKAANDWHAAYLAGGCIVEDFHTFFVHDSYDKTIAQFRYEPEQEPIKEGVLCVGEYRDGGISIGRSLGVFDFEGLDTFCNNTKAAGRGNIGFNLKNARPVTLADLVGWGYEVDTVKSCETMCQTCLHVNVKPTSEPCKSCETTMGTNYEKRGIDGR